MAGPKVSQLKDAPQVEHVRAHRKAALDYIAPVPVELTSSSPPLINTTTLPCLWNGLERPLRYCMGSDLH